REARPGHHVALVQHFSAAQPDRFGQTQPGFDAALAVAGAVVVHDALDPAATDGRIGTVGQNRRVLHRDRLLVIEGVGDPVADVGWTQPAGVHLYVERMRMVVTLRLRASLGHR